MKNGWLATAGRFRVEHYPLPYLTGSILQDTPPLGLLHTTQGPTIEGALSVFAQHYAPPFTVGLDRTGKLRLLQHCPLGIMGQALKNKAGGVETNRRLRAQIEIVGYCNEKSWLPAGETFEALVALMITLKHEAGIPFRHPVVARGAAKWETATGWVGHRDAPENDHSDPGLLNYRTLFKACEAVDAKLYPKPKVKTAPRVTDRVRCAPLKYRAWGTPPTSCDERAVAIDEDFWRWAAWRDQGANPRTRPAGLPARIPAAWWARYKVHVHGRKATV